jgi:hypothetical protein
LIELWRKVQVEIKVFFGRSTGGLGGRKTCKWGGRRDHQQRQGLRTGGGERLFFAILKVVCLDVIDAIQYLGF